MPTYKVMCAEKASSGVPDRGQTCASKSLARLMYEPLVPE
jgi:hypothetical protein